VFDVYDTPIKLDPRSDSPPKRAGKINEWSLFKLMALVSSKPSENSINQQELLGLHNHESDMFLEIFSEEMCKLTRVLAEKKRQQQV